MRCERHGCTMAVRTCLARRALAQKKAARANGWRVPLPDCDVTGCLACEVGAALERGAAVEEKEGVGAAAGEKGNGLLVCGGDDCPAGGAAQPEEMFYRTGGGRYVDRLCKTCRNKKTYAAQKARRAAARNAREKVTLKSWAQLKGVAADRRAGKMAEPIAAERLAEGAAVALTESGAVKNALRRCVHPACASEGKALGAGDFYEVFGVTDPLCKACRDRETEAMLLRVDRGRGNDGKSAVVDLARMPELYAAIRELAERELRTVENQVFYLLRWHVERADKRAAGVEPLV